MTAGLPEPRSVFASVSIGRNHVIFGGETSPSFRGHAGAGNFSGSVVLLRERGGRFFKDIFEF